MRRLLRCALGGVLGLLFVLGACNRTDVPSSTEDSSRSDAASGGSEANPAEPDLAGRAFPLLAWAVHTLDKEYFDRNRFEPRVQLRSALDGLGLHTPEFFAEMAEGGDVVRVRVRSSSTQFRVDDLETLDDAARRLEDVLVYAQTVLDLDPEALHELEYAAINGLLSPLDPHTILLTPEQHADLGVRTRGTFGGIGAQIRAERRRIVIVRVLPGMPAEGAGLLAGDVVLRIAGQATVNMTSAEAQALLRGPVGTSVKVKVRRQDTSLDIEIERAVIRVDSVTATPLPGGIEHIRITNFQEDTAKQLLAAVEQATQAGRLRGMVLDLRGNAGGLLVQATQIVDAFVPKGELVVVRSAYGREVDEAKEGTGVPADLPVVVLVDEESASAAEIVSGGLQALGRATILGRSSFGKGSVQVVRPSVPYGRELALKLTIAEYLVAGDQRIQARGVVPDLELLPVEPTGIRGVVRYYDLERFERARERARMANHPSAKHELAAEGSSESSVRLRYYATTELPEGLVVDGPVPDPLRDPEVRIAREIALALPGAVQGRARRDAIAAQGVALQKAEDARIERALGAGGVRWGSEGANEGTLEATAEVTAAGAIAAGQPFVLRLSLTNPSDETLQRVHAITDCVHDELDGIEMMVGDIEPGESIVREVELRVMPWHADFVGELDVAVHIGEPGETPDAVARAMFETRAAPRPQLSYDVWIVDDPGLATRAPKRPPTEAVPGVPPFAVEGNGDGMLQPGERVLLAFAARNQGEGDSPDVRAYLRNLSGAQGLLEEGLVPLGPLAAGASGTGAFGISVGPKADPTKPFLLELTVGDATLRTSAQGKLSLAVLGEAPHIEAKSTAVAVGSEPIVLRAGAHASAPVVAEVDPEAVLRLGGRVGGWRYLASGTDPSRRWFFPADLEGIEPRASGKTAQQAVHVRTSVQPPTVTLEDTPRITSADSIAVAGVISHPERVRDVVVMVRPPGHAQADRKVDYFAAAADSTRLEFSAEVPLAPGGNRVLVLARDGGKVSVRRDVWIYRGASG